MDQPVDLKTPGRYADTIDTAMVESFMACMRGATPKELACYTVQLSYVVEDDQPASQCSSVSSETVAECLHRLRLLLIDEP